LATRFGEAPIRAFTLMKVIGLDIWIGIWCLILAFVSVVRWEKGEGQKQIAVGAGIIWERFPKFVIGFLAASIIVSIVGTMVPAGYLGKANWEGKFKGKDYKADFSQFQVPPEFADRLAVDPAKKTLTFKGVLAGDNLKALSAKVADPNQIAAIGQLAASTNWGDSVLGPNVIGPVKNLRTWAFVLCFLCIGLSTRFKEMFTFGMKPFWAFTIGVLVNVPLGIILSAFVFADYWMKV